MVGHGPLGVFPLCYNCFDATVRLRVIEKCDKSEGVTRENSRAGLGDKYNKAST